MARTHPVSARDIGAKFGRESRTLLHRATRALFGAQWVRVMRWMRSRRDLRRLARADIVIVSFPKSGRTWLMVLLSRLFQTKHNLPPTFTIDGGDRRGRAVAVPAFLFTHGRFINAMRPVVGEGSPYSGKKLIFLARHPADTAVSYYHQVRYRIDPMKRQIKGLPDDLSQVSMFDFVANPAWGMTGIIEYLNAWAEALSQHPHHLLVRYEDLHVDPKRQLLRIAEFMGESFEGSACEEAIQFASFEQLQQKERDNFFGNRRLQPRDDVNPASFKVRRGKVGGYRDYFTEHESAWIEDQIADRLHPLYGYQSKSPPGNGACQQRAARQ